MSIEIEVREDWEDGMKVGQRVYISGLSTMDLLAAGALASTPANLSPKEAAARATRTAYWTERALIAEQRSASDTEEK